MTELFHRSKALSRKEYLQSTSRCQSEAELHRSASEFIIPI